jgi:F-type H+-transporting ATPase subunit b
MTKGILRRWTLIASLAVGGPCLFSAARARAEESAAQTTTAAVGHEEGEAHPTPTIDGKKLALQLVNFGALLFILIWFGGPAIRKALVARHQQLKDDLVGAALVRAEAEERLAKQEARLAALEQEIEGIRRGVKVEAEAEKARLIALAEERAKRIREETSFVLEQQIKEAAERLRREVALAAVDLAEQMVRKSLGASDQQRLVDTFVADVGAPSGAPGGSSAPRGQA